MNGEEYFKHLISLKKENKRDCLNKTVNLNNTIYYVDYADLEILSDILFMVLLRKLKLTNMPFQDIEKLCIEFGKDPILFKPSFKDLIIAEEEYYKKMGIRRQSIQNNMKISIILQKYLYLESKIEREIKLLKNNFQKDMYTGSYLSDFNHENKNPLRTASIIAFEDSHLGVISHSIYKFYQSTERHKLLSKEVQYLLHSFIFKFIKFNTFYTKYFNFFIESSYLKNFVLFNENEPVKDIIYIKEGEIELSINVNFDDLNLLINKLIRKTKFKNKEFMKINEESIYLFN